MAESDFEGVFGRLLCTHALYGTTHASLQGRGAVFDKEALWENEMTDTE